MASLDAIRTDDVPTNCRVETTVTSGTFDQYYALADIGNRPSERHLVNVSVEIAVRSRQEELAVLLSSLDRSHQYPDFAHTYEMRLTNVYTVLYRETLKLRAYHSPQDKLFPADRFRLRFLIGHDGNLTVLANDDPARVLLAVVDTQPPLEPHYISFASRMNAYPIRFSLGCGLPELTPEATTADPDMFSATQATELSTPPVGVNNACPPCPECAKQRCQVVVRACADNARDANDRSRDEQEQRYYFYFNLLLQKNKTKQAIEPSSGRKAKP
ncbi:uncharacterized protein LOC131290964 [Anopheles ziemanni]|uniref:uncharacterized protein LOC131268993 n=1 Tax=Anopheles coustani TaxID=139045 RepID=UPI00265925D7|nr:uncharacterized protein LOC131268993 [Anopheles coustani]XP_058176139.1 uncharacterized protein LOC131290964 [Anopheles ziemanni]